MFENLNPLSSGTAEQVEGFDVEEIPASVERTPTMLVLDTSVSMADESPTPDGQQVPRIEQVNEGLQLFKEEVERVEPASERVDVAVVTFSSKATMAQRFVPISEWSLPVLEAKGGSSVGQGIEKAIELVEARKEAYRERGIPYNRPLIWLLTDGEPTDMVEGGPTWNRVQDLLDTEDAFELFAMHVGDEEGAETLSRLVEPTGRPALQIKEGMFTEYFQFLSNSVARTAESADDAVTFDEDQLAEITDDDFVQKTSGSGEPEADAPEEETDTTSSTREE